ncbi:MAG: hypothetical protein Q9190_000027 [Brigantiaea leucoxantha]
MTHTLPTISPALNIINSLYQFSLQELKTTMSSFQTLASTATTASSSSPTVDLNAPHEGDSQETQAYVTIGVPSFVMAATGFAVLIGILIKKRKDKRTAIRGKSVTYLQQKGELDATETQLHELHVGEELVRQELAGEGQMSGSGEQGMRPRQELAGEEFSHEMSGGEFSQELDNHLLKVRNAAVSRSSPAVM